MSGKALKTKGKLLLWGIPAACIIGLAIALIVRPLILPLRADYMAYKFNSIRWHQMFGDEYEKAVQGDATWVKDPEAVALRVAGYPNVDGTRPDMLTRQVMDTGGLLFVVTSLNELDDSIRNEQTRIEVIQGNGVWAVQWAGVRYQCWRSMNIGWRTTACP